MLCGKINKNARVDCANPLVSGVKDRLILINHEDWESATITYDPANPLLITDIALPAGTKAYVYEGLNGSVEPSDNLVVADAVYPLYTHQVVYRVFSASANAKQQLEKKTLGRFVSIVENNGRGNSAFELRGDYVGLKVTALTRTKKDTATQGAFVVTLATPENEGEPHLPATVFSTTYAATKTLIDSLIDNSDVPAGG